MTPEERAHHRLVQERLRRHEAEKAKRRAEDRNAREELLRRADAGDKGAALCLYYQGRPMSKMLPMKDGTYTYDRDTYERSKES